jgi:hypothetical protein
VLDEKDIIVKIEKKWGDMITHIAFLDTDSRGYKRFTCADGGVDSILTVDSDGYVISRPVKSKFGDVLGTI